jgi:hypothetical protein
VFHGFDAAFAIDEESDWDRGIAPQATFSGRADDDSSLAREVSNLEPQL